MTKRLSVTLCMILLASVMLYAKKISWNYEIEGVGTGVEGTYLVKVTVIAKKPNVSDDEILRSAIHGILFRGFESKQYRQHQRPMVESGAESQHEAFFNSFFSSDLSGYARTIDGSRQVKMVSKTYRVSAQVQVHKEKLRQYMEQQNIIKPLNDGF